MRIIIIFVLLVWTITAEADKGGKSGKAGLKSRVAVLEAQIANLQDNPSNQAGPRIVDSLDQELGVPYRISSIGRDAEAFMPLEDGGYLAIVVSPNEWTVPDTGVSNAHYLSTDCSGEAYGPSGSDQESFLIKPRASVKYTPPLDPSSGEVFGPILVGDGVDVSLPEVCSFWGSSGSCTTVPEYLAGSFGGVEAASEFLQTVYGSTCFTEGFLRDFQVRTNVTWQKVVQQDLPEFTPPYRIVFE